MYKCLGGQDTCFHLSLLSSQKRRVYIIQVGLIFLKETSIFKLLSTRIVEESYAMVVLTVNLTHSRVIWQGSLSEESHGLRWPAGVGMFVKYFNLH